MNDWYQSDYYSTYPADGWPSNPPGPATGTYKVLRGGSFGTGWSHVRVAHRYDFNPSSRGVNFGFRFAGVAPGQ